jgi:hypothetical protein
VLEHGPRLRKREHGRPIVFAHDNRSFEALRLHHPPHHGHMRRDEHWVVVEMHGEHVEGIPSRVHDLLEELARRAAFGAAEHIVPATAKHHHCLEIGGTDRPVEHRELRHILRCRPRPQQALVAGLVVALPVLHATPVQAPDRAVAHQITEQRNARIIAMDCWLAGTDGDHVHVTIP